MKDPAKRPLDLRHILAQIIVATIVEREFRNLVREGARIDDCSTEKYEEAGRRKHAFVSMLTEGERAAARASFGTVLADLPGTAELPYAIPAQTPACYPLRLFTICAMGEDGGALSA